MERLRVFVSSTSADLQEHRQVVRDAVMGLDHHPDDMIFWSADPRSGTTTSLDRVLQCDVLILLVAHRYGHVPVDAEHSVTEQEYRAAHDAEIPVLAFFVDPAIPWPPALVEWEAKERLDAFKALVSSHVTRRVFRTPDELAAQVVQALAQLAARRPSTTAPSRRRFSSAVRPVSLPARLTADPDLLVQIGTAADGLPLLLDVRRGRDLSGPFAELAASVGSATRPVPAAMLDTFRQALEEFSVEAWAADRLMPVLRQDGQLENMYVSGFTLGGSFASVLAALIDIPAGGRVSRMFDGPGGSVPFHGAVTATCPVPLTVIGPQHELQSTGGRNRFLGISPDTGAAYSVGRDPDTGAMREWRPFVCENALGAFPDATFSVPRGYNVPVGGALADAPDLLMAGLCDQPTDALARYGETLTVKVTRQAVVEIVARVARELADLHERGMVHGDVKPHNVLLAEDRIVLIDSFEVENGGISPGWTPDWSAPEQVLGQPLTPAADIYPLAVMLATLLGGELVGEVRKYRTPVQLTGQREFDIFHDPSLFLEPQEDGLTAAGIRAWRRLVERGLRFDPAQRHGSAQEFADEVAATVAEHPLPGDRHFAPSGQLMAARLVDGSEVVARVVLDPGEDLWSVPGDGLGWQSGYAAPPPAYPSAYPPVHPSPPEYPPGSGPPAPYGHSWPPDPAEPAHPSSRTYPAGS